MLSRKKKIVIISAFCLLLAVTGALNIILNNNILKASDDVITTSSFFATYRLDRTDTRNQEVLYLDAIIASTTASAEAKTTAETKKQGLVAMMETELVLEGLIKAKGFNDVIISTSNSNLNVIIKSAELTPSEVAQIVDVVRTQTDYGIDNIKIIPVE